MTPQYFDQGAIIICFTDAGFEGVTPTDWSGMLDKVELSDPSQLEVAALISAKMAVNKDGGKAVNVVDDLVDEVNMETNKTAENDTELTLNEKFPRTPLEQADYDRSILAMQTGLKLLTFSGMKEIERAKSLSKRYVSTI